MCLSTETQTRQYLDQQLSMLEDIAGAQEESARAHLLLGRVAAAEGEHKEAHEHSAKAHSLAVEGNARALASVAKCFVGASLARSMFDDVLRATGQEMAASHRNSSSSSSSSSNNNNNSNGNGNRKR